MLIRMLAPSVNVRFLMPRQNARQLFDGHAVDAGGALVSLDRSRFDILTVTDRLRQAISPRRAFGCGDRHGCFGLSSRRTRGRCRTNQPPVHPVRPRRDAPKLRSSPYLDVGNGQWPVTLGGVGYALMVALMSQGSGTAQDPAVATVAGPAVVTATAAPVADQAWQASPLA
jgi:hypothetical protein